MKEVSTHERSFIEDYFLTDESKRNDRSLTL